jgi:hypothetical protein
MHQESINYNKNCAVPFRAHVQAHHEPNFKNSQQPQSIDCIYLRYVDNMQGGNHLLDLNTGHSIKRRAITQVPIIRNIIELAHKMATVESKMEYKFQTNQTIFYTTLHGFQEWIMWIMSLIRIDQHKNNESNTNDQHKNETEANVYDEMNPNEVADILNNNQITNYYSHETENPKESDETEH